MLAIKTSAGVIPEMNPRNLLHIGEEAGKSGIHSDFESQGILQQKSEIGASVALQKGLMPSKLKKIIIPFCLPSAVILKLNVRDSIFFVSIHDYRPRVVLDF